MKVHLKKNLGLTVIVSLILIAGFAMFARNLQADTVIPEGDDTFNTGNGTQAQFSFPAGFFGSGSLAFTATLNMVSDGFPDTVVHRQSAISVPGSTSLELSSLSLKANSQLAVPFQGGATQYWNVKARKNPNLASSGNMTLYSNGTGTASLTVNYVLLCERNGVTVTKDDCPPIVFTPPSGAPNNVTWSLPWKIIVKHQAPTHAHLPVPPPG
jgi:hypothetical protein